MAALAWSGAIARQFRTVATTYRMTWYAIYRRLTINTLGCVTTSDGLGCPGLHELANEGGLYVLCTDPVTLGHIQHPLSGC